MVKGATMAGFENMDAYSLVSREQLEDIHAEGIYLHHKKSGARIALIPCGDDNKVFNIAFRTPPEDSTGVAHIIEHTVLCGSEKFPLKDPFIELVKGSLNTFLNAMTYPDKTMYPVASTNDTDFRNLMHVYLDAVFRPNIYHEQNIFRQEGWHYEIEDENDPLTINGVVYNEMKGAYSTPESVLERETMRALFPDTAYGKDSGGDPDHIPELTYENYLQFHRRYYHPSNCYITLYGNLDMEDALRFLDEEYLSGYEAIDPDSCLTKQDAFEAPAVVEENYPVADEDPLEENSYLSYNIAAGNPLSIKEMITCEVLDYALLSAPGAPVRQALLDAGIGKAVYGSFNDGMLQPYFSVTAKNADASQLEAFTDVIMKVLKEQAEKGIDRDSLEAGLATLEFQFREADYSSFPKGLVYSILMMDTWLYDDAMPFASLRKLDVMNELKGDISSGYFERFIREKMLRNPHAAALVLKPRRGMLAEQESVLSKALEEKKAAMSREEILEAVRITEALKKWQEEPETEEHIASLPVLERSMIGREAVRISNEEESALIRDCHGEEQEAAVVWHNALTNGIGYLDLCFDLSFVKEEDLPYASLLRAALQNVSTGKHTYLELGNAVNAKTGGISSLMTAYEDPKDPEGYQPFLIMRGKALYPNFGALAELLREIMTESLFDDEKRIREILSEKRAGLEISLQQAGNAAAALRGLAYGSAQSAYGDLTGGIFFYRFIRDLEEHYEERKGEIREKLESLAKELFLKDRLLISCTCEESAREDIRKSLGACLVEGGLRDAGTPQRVLPIGKRNEGFMTSGKIQFVTMTGNFRQSGFPYTGTLAMLQQILTYGYLWQNIRVKGGAYGCSAIFRRNGDTVFSSYRDPGLDSTREVFLKIPEYLEQFSADEKQMTKHIIGTISSMDTPLTPSLLGAVSLRCYLQGTTQEELQQRREEVLAATDEDIRSLAPCIRAVLAENNFCVIGGSTRIREGQDLFGSTENLL